MGKNDAGARELCHSLFKFPQVDRVVALGHGSDILMQQDRQVVVGRELVDRPERAVIGAGVLAKRERSQVVVAEQHLTNSTPDIRILGKKTLDMP